MDNNIFDDNYRKKFLDTADCVTLNKYLKNMEKLAQKQGDKYKKYAEIYYKDLDYLLNNSECTTNNNVFSLFTEGDPKNMDKFKDMSITSEQPCDTEGYVNKINNLFSPKVNELKLVKLNLESLNPNYKKYIGEFINIIININVNFTSVDHKQVSVYLNEGVKVIVHNEIYLREAFLYLGKMLNGKRGLLCDELMKKLAELRSKRHNISKDKYELIKGKLLEEYIVKVGFNVVCVTKLVEKVIYSYKNLNKKI